MYVWRGILWYVLVLHTNQEREREREKTPKNMANMTQTPTPRKKEKDSPALQHGTVVTSPKKNCAKKGNHTYTLSIPLSATNTYNQCPSRLGPRFLGAEQVWGPCSSHSHALIPTFLRLTGGEGERERTVLPLPSCMPVRTYLLLFQGNKKPGSGSIGERVASGCVCVVESADFSFVTTKFPVPVP